MVLVKILVNTLAKNITWLFVWIHPDTDTRTVRTRTRTRTVRIRTRTVRTRTRTVRTRILFSLGFLITF